MNNKVLIVEDQFIEANNLQMILERAGYTVCPIALSVPQALAIIDKENPGLVLLDIFLQGNLTGIDLAKILREKSIAFIYLSANSNKNILEAARETRPYGFLVKPFREKDVLVTLNVSRYLHEQNLDAILRREAGLQEQLESVFSQTSSFEEKIIALARAFQPYIPFDFLALLEFDANGEPITVYGLHRTGLYDYQKITINDLSRLAAMTNKDLLSLQKKTYRETRATFYNQVAFTQVYEPRSLRRLLATLFKTESHLSQSIQLADKSQYHFFFYSQNPNAYITDHIAGFNRWKPLIAQGLAIHESSKINPDTNQSFAKKNQFKNSGESIPANPFEGIVGRSHGLLTVLDHISVVSHSDTSVFILGESGTGKESIAEAIHYISPRRERPLIKVNCAALPTSLIESELFGHERGAFTGATEKRVGKFEQADGGTIFLDEIGEIHNSVQVKLLRVLQEKEIERVGGNGPIKINVRVIAATNRNMEVEISKGRFRLDLFYRLNVFPITLPPLRERKDDIPELVNQFIKDLSLKNAKRVTGISEKALTELMNYTWPGNIRELKNIIERSVLLTKGPIITELPLPQVEKTVEHSHKNKEKFKSLEENERDYIIEVLRQCDGKIFGRGGAAEVLGLNTSTLNSKIKKLGIDREKLF